MGNRIGACRTPWIDFEEYKSHPIHMCTVKHCQAEADISHNNICLLTGKDTSRHIRFTGTKDRDILLNRLAVIGTLAHVVID